MKLLIFADFHYKKRMYASTPGDLGAILRRAHESGAELILHMGDFSNDYAHSPEVTRLLLDNPYGLPVYGLYGNHEMESKGNTMAVVTPAMIRMKKSPMGSPLRFRLESGFRMISAPRRMTRLSRRNVRK